MKYRKKTSAIIVSNTLPNRKEQKKTANTRSPFCPGQIQGGTHPLHAAASTNTDSLPDCINRSVENVANSSNFRYNMISYVQLK